MTSSLGLGTRSSSAAVATTRPCAEATLDGACLHERLLDAVETVVGAQPLDRRHLVPVRLGREHEAGADELAVEKDGAGAALALLAGVLRAGQLERVAERRQQALARPDVCLARLSVDGQIFMPAVFTRTLSSARLVSTWSAWRR